MLRPLAILICALSLSLAACGDDEEDTGGGGSDTATATETATQETTPSAAGCQPADKPKPKDVKDGKAPAMKIDEKKKYTAVIETNCGTIEIALDVKRAPKTVNSFVSLAQDKFFDGLGFHRLVPGFVIQGGDPAGTGQGGPGYNVVETPPGDLKYTTGIVAMAKTETDKPGTSGSQFFIVTAPDAGLPPDYALLGKVSKGQDVATKIEAVPAAPDGQPSEPVVMSKVSIKTS